jgi:hypothetical protein
MRGEEEVSAYDEDEHLEEDEDESWFVLYDSSTGHGWRGPFPSRDAAETEWNEAIIAIGRDPIYARTVT